ncbi:MAG: SAM-dependent methyltransferase [Anaerolineales bacterium]|nr:SAM-dependent methyltransferase [Anaerolineales bacterium]
MSDSNNLPSSFRDPQGFLFRRGTILYRQINQAGKENYDTLLKSGLYKELVDARLMISHQEVDEEPHDPSLAYKVIKPKVVEFISYPYEWCFSQLKDAALTTLQIQKKALDYNMVLQDASAYNIQFVDGKPMLIDTLSLQTYEEGKPWVAYRQFCQHFLNPLTLMAFTDIRLVQLLKVYLDGIPLDLAVRLLPVNTRLRLPLYIHIYLHAKSQSRYAGKSFDKDKIKPKMSKMQLLGLVASLESAVRKLSWSGSNTDWANYYAEEHNYTPAAMDQKIQIISEFLDRVTIDNLWDLGANTGEFSRMATKRKIPTIAFDIDPGAVERNYLISKDTDEAHMLPLVMDLTNPSPAIGWQNQERLSFMQRQHPDLVLALALVHHFVISNNVPLIKLAEFFSHLSRWLIIEFVPKTDSQVQRMLSTRKDIFLDYSSQAFASSFNQFFQIHEKKEIFESDREIYLMERK